MATASEVFEQVRKLSKEDQDALWIKIGAEIVDGEEGVSPSLLERSSELRNLFSSLIRNHTALEKWRKRRYSSDARDLAREGIKEGERLKAQGKPRGEMFDELEESLKQASSHQSDG